MNKLEYRSNIIEYNNLLNFSDCEILIQKNQKKIINKGGTSNIYKIDSPKCGSIILKYINDKFVNQLLNEIFYLNLIKKIIYDNVCPNFIIIYSHTPTYIIMEYADGDLSQILYKINDLKLLLNIYFQIIVGILVMQKILSINHNDLYLKNIFYKKINQNIKYFKYNINNETFYLPNLGYLIMIADFGMSTKLSEKDILSNSNKDYDNIFLSTLIDDICWTFRKTQYKLIQKLLTGLHNSKLYAYYKEIKDIKPQNNWFSSSIIWKLLYYAIDIGLIVQIKKILEQNNYLNISIIFDLIEHKDIGLCKILDRFFSLYKSNINISSTITFTINYE